MFASRRIAHFLARNGDSLARKKHTLPDLAYEYSALEPAISRDIMSLHHGKHHAAYVANLNIAEEKLSKALAARDVSAAVALGPALRFNGGGHINHSIFWTNLTGETTQPRGALVGAIQTNFETMEALKKELCTVSVAVQGSGWGWLALHPKTKRLVVTAQPNQDPLQAATGLVPLLGIDVWEHAYYLQYRNARASYVEAIFDIINWNDVSDRYQAALGKC